MIVVVLVINLIICSIGLIEVLLVGIDLVLFVDEDLFFKIFKEIKLMFLNVRGEILIF